MDERKWQLLKLSKIAIIGIGKKKNIYNGWKTVDCSRIANRSWSTTKSKYDH
jgi:hypothetical protein